MEVNLVAIGMLAVDRPGSCRGVAASLRLRRHH